MGFGFDRLLLLRQHVVAGLLHVRPPVDVAHLEVGVAGVEDLDLFDDEAVDNLAIRALDEAVLVDAREAGERRDQPDVRSFRRLDRADAAVVRRMHVADFESRAFAREAARSQGRKTPLVRDLRQRVGLVHELRELARSEELADGGHDRLGVHQVVRHGRRHLLVHRHLFLDGALHAHQADAELVLEQLAHRAHAAVAQVVDIVHRKAADAPQLEQVADHVVEILGVQDLAVQRMPVLVLRVRSPGRRRVFGVVVDLDVELHAAHAREIVFARVEEHALEQLRGRVQRGRVARTQLAVDLQQRVVLRLHRVLLERRRDHGSRVVPLREEQLEAFDLALQQLADARGGQLLVGFEQHLAGAHVHDVGRYVGPFQIVGRDLDLLDLGLLNFLEQAGGDLAPRRDHRLARPVEDGVRELHALQARGHVPVQLLVLDGELVDAVEGAQNLLVGLQAERAQEYRAVELALAVDADIEQVLVVVLEFHPASPVGDDLAQVVALRRDLLEEDARRPVQLRNDHALGPVDDERPILGHQRHFTEEDFLFLDVAHGPHAGFGVLVEHRQPDGDLERSGVGHAAFLALRHVVLELQAHRVAAAVAEGDDVLVEGAALRAQHVAGVERVGLDGGAAAWIAAGRTQVVQPFQVAALAFPVADGVIDELELAQPAEIRDRKYAVEDALEAHVLPLAGEQVHLQEALVGILLYFDEIRDRNRRFDPGEVDPLPDAVCRSLHC